MSTKGAGFEIKVCVQLSLWVSGGKNRDLFWRSAMSGGRATTAFKRGVRLDRQAGDICAIAPEGHRITDTYFLECKHRRNIGLESFLLKNIGPMANWWKKTKLEAARHDRQPVMIVRGNNMPILVVTERTDYKFNPAPLISSALVDCCIGLFETTLKYKPWGITSPGGIERVKPNEHQTH